MNKNSFVEDDLKEHKKFDEAVAKFAQWHGANTQELVNIYRSLVWFANLRAKIEANLMEVKSVKQFKKDETEVTE